MSNFLSNYKALSSNRDISARVDIKHKRLYVPRQWQGKRISVNDKGAIIECAQGALVNAQGFASIGKASASDIKAMAAIINR